MYGALELTTDAYIDKQFAVNVKGVINVIRGFLPHLRANRAGKIINVSSVWVSVLHYLWALIQYV